MSKFDYYTYRINTITENVNREISFYQNNEYAKIYPLLNYLNYLRGRINADNRFSSTVTFYDRSGTIKEMKKMNITEYVKDMDVLMFSNPWEKLKDIHKTIKIKEFVDNLEYSINDKKKINKNKKFLKKELVDGLHQKKFTKKKNSINYDTESMQITEISCISYNKKKKIYEINWN
jgi:hypothetical protein